MKLHWFNRKGIFYIPVHWVGWLILAAALTYSVYIFFDIDSHSHSVSDTLINFGFNFLIVGAVYSIIGYIAE